MVDSDTESGLHPQEAVGCTIPRTETLTRKKELSRTYTREPVEAFSVKIKFACYKHFHILNISNAMLRKCSVFISACGQFAGFNVTFESNYVSNEKK